MRLPLRLMSLLTGLLLAGSASAQWGGAQVFMMPSPLGGQDDPGTTSFLGVYLQDVDAERAEELELPTERGALVAEVMPDTPAAEAGLQDLDVIVNWNDTAVHSAKQFKRLVAETPPGREVEIDVIREGESVHLHAVVGTMNDRPEPDRPDPFRDAMPPWHPPVMQDDWPGDAHPADTWNRPTLGVLLVSLNDQLGAYFGLEDDQTGVLVSGVMEDTPAEAAGLTAGDILLSLDGESLASPRDVRQALVGKQGTVDIDILRDREPRTLEVQLTEAEAEEDEDEEEEEDEEEDEDDDATPPPATPEPFPKQAM